jgi:hypothetical protein
MLNLIQHPDARRLKLLALRLLDPDFRQDDGTK